MKHLKHFLLALTSLFLLNSCGKDDDKKAAPVPSKADFYFFANIGGKDVLYEQSSSYSNGVGTNYASTTLKNNMFQESQLCTFLSNATVKPVLYVAFNKNFPQKPTECSQMESIFKIGSYQYSQKTTGPNPESTEGVWIMYQDANNVTWDSEWGSQAGSTFELTEHIVNEKDQLSEKISLLKFSCKVYDNKGNVLELKNGQMRTHTVQCGHL